MIIDENLLLTKGAVYEDYAAKETIFHEGESPHFYLQIVHGTVELNNFHEDGKEFTFNILNKGQSIGESLLFGCNIYPMNAVARTDCKILKLKRSCFLSLIFENPEVMLGILNNLSARLYYKYLMLFNNSASEPSIKSGR